MTTIKFSEEENKVIITKVQQYFQERLNQELGRFDAEFFLEFISEELGKYYYNRGLYDAQAILLKKLDSITEAISEIEIPTEVSK